MTDIQPSLPLTIISGYLGSGKTTLVNHLLRNANGRRLMVLVNDFGDLPIDADLIQSRDGDMINLANGCACCSMGGDLFNALVDVLDQKPWPDHLLIEASGVADPARIANIALAEPDLKLDATIALVDAETFENHADDPLIGETLTQQLAVSDLILINKSDLVEAKAMENVSFKLGTIAPNATRIETQYASLPLDLAVGLELASSEKKAEHSDDGDHSAAYAKWSISYDRPLDREAFEVALERLDGRVLRLKGIVRFKGNDTPQVIQLVGRRHSIAAFDGAENVQNGLIAIGFKGSLDRSLLDEIFSNV